MIAFSRIPLLAALACSVATLAASAQDPVGPPDAPEAAPSAPLPFRVAENGFRFRVDAVPGATHVALWLRLGTGYRHDPPGETGLARVLALAAALELPPVGPERPLELHVLPEATLIGITVPAGEAAGVLDRFAAWFTAGSELDDAALLQVRGRAVLRADDELDALPGPVLAWRARRALAGARARQGAGLPEELRTLTPERLRAAFRERFDASNTTLVALGGVDSEAFTERLEERFGGLSGSGRAPEPVAAGEAPPVEAVTVHPRVEAPFVLAAIPAPHWGDAGYLPFLIGMEVVRQRAARVFGQPRGGEFAAEFPPVSWDYLHQPALATVGRRGRDGDTVERVQAEITSFLAELRTGASVPEIGSAALALRNALDTPPFQTAWTAVITRHPGALHQRGHVVAVHDLWGWPADLAESIGDVPVPAVLRALHEALAAERLRWFALTPG